MYECKTYVFVSEWNTIDEPIGILNLKLAEKYLNLYMIGPKGRYMHAIKHVLKTLSTDLRLASKIETNLTVWFIDIMHNKFKVEALLLLDEILVKHLFLLKMTLKKEMEFLLYSRIRSLQVTNLLISSFTFQLEVCFLHCLKLTYRQTWFHGKILKYFSRQSSVVYIL